MNIPSYSVKNLFEPEMGLLQVSGHQRRPGTSEDLAHLWTRVPAIPPNKGGRCVVSRASLLFLDNSLVKLPCASGDSGWEASSMMTRNDAVVMQQFCMMMTFNDALHQKIMMDTVTTRAWEFSQTVNQIILRGWLVRALWGCPRHQQKGS